MSYEPRICDPFGGGSQHDWRVTLSDWVPESRTRVYVTHVIQKCRCGRLRALLWNAKGKRLPPMYWWETGRKPAEPLGVRFTPDDHRERMLKRVRELEAEQRKNERKPATSSKPRGIGSQHKAA